MRRRPPGSTLFPYTPLFRSVRRAGDRGRDDLRAAIARADLQRDRRRVTGQRARPHLVELDRALLTRVQNGAAHVCTPLNLHTPLRHAPYTLTIVGGPRH